MDYAFNESSALIVIDVQKAFCHPDWGNRNNPDAEKRIEDLLFAWRGKGLPVFHVRHVSAYAEGLFRQGEQSFEFKPEAQPLPGEPIYTKSVNSAFIGTRLESDLRAHGIDTVVLVGLTTNHCVSTTARISGNLGFATYLVEDATATFDRQDLRGELRPASEVHASALSDLKGEFASIVSTAEVIGAVAKAVVATKANAIQQDAPSPAAQAYINRILAALRDRQPVAVLNGTLKAIDDLMRGATAETLSARPAPGKWSANEILAHLADVETVLGFRLRQILSHDGIAIAAFDQDRWAAVSNYGTIPAARSVSRLAANRAANIDLIAQLTPEQMDMHGVHSERGRETVSHLCLMWAGHDLNHLAQLQTLLS